MDDKMNQQQGKKEMEAPSQHQGSPITERALEAAHGYIHMEGEQTMMRNINVGALTSLVVEEANELAQAVADKDGGEILDACLDLVGAVGMILDGVDSWVLNEAINHYLHEQARRKRTYAPHMAIIQGLPSRLAHGRQQMCIFEGGQFSQGIARGDRTTEAMQKRALGKGWVELKNYIDFEGILGELTLDMAWKLYMNIVITKFGVDKFSGKTRKVFDGLWAKYSDTTPEIPEVTDEPVAVSEEASTSSSEDPYGYLYMTNRRGAGFSGGAIIRVPAGNSFDNLTDVEIGGFVEKGSTENSIKLPTPSPLLSALKSQVQGKTIGDLAKLKTVIKKAARAKGLTGIVDNNYWVTITWPKGTKIAQNSTMVWNLVGSKATISILENIGGSINE